MTCKSATEEKVDRPQPPRDRNTRPDNGTFHDTFGRPLPPREPYVRTAPKD